MHGNKKNVSVFSRKKRNFIVKQIRFFTKQLDIYKFKRFCPKNRYIFLKNARYLQKHAYHGGLAPQDIRVTHGWDIAMYH
jgi:hypothetical protein